MQIEVMRSLKFNAAMRFIAHPKTKLKLGDFLIIEILSQDEE